MGSSSYEPSKSRSSARSKIIDDRASIRSQLTAQDSIEGGLPVIAGLIAAVQAIIFSTAIIVIPVVISAVVSTTLIDQDFVFSTALKAGLGFWALAHGAILTVSGESVTLVPLGLTALVLFVSSLSVRRSLLPHRLSVATYLGIYALVSLVAALVAGDGLMRALVTGTLVGWCSVQLGMRRRADAEQWRSSTSLVTARFPSWLIIPMRATAGVLAATTLLSALTVLVWLFLGRDAMSNALSGWSLDAFSGIALGLAQLAILPNLLVWAVSWLCGAGFVIGPDTIVSPAEVVLGPLPNIPLLGALPQSSAPHSFGVVFVILVVACGVVSGVLAARRETPFTWWYFVVVPALSAALACVTLAVILWLSGGLIGAGESVWFGARIGQTLGLFGAYIALGSFIAVMVTRVEVRRSVVLVFSRSEKSYTLDDDTAGASAPSVRSAASADESESRVASAPSAQSAQDADD